MEYEWSYWSVGQKICGVIFFVAAVVTWFYAGWVYGETSNTPSWIIAGLEFLVVSCSLLVAYKWRQQTENPTSTMWLIATVVAIDAVCVGLIHVFGATSIVELLVAMQIVAIGIGWLAHRNIKPVKFRPMQRPLFS